MPPSLGQWRRFDHRTGLRHDSRCVLADSAGRLWIGSRRRGVSLYDGYSVQTFTTRDGLASNSVRCVLQDRSGVVWIGTDAGLSRFDDDGFTTPDNGPERISIRCLLEDSDGAIELPSIGV